MSEKTRQTPTGSQSSPRVAEGPADHRRSLISRIFVGDQGLRAGWSALIFTAIVVIFCLGANALADWVTHDPRKPTMIEPLPGLLNESALLGALFLATLIMARIEKRPVLSYGFQDGRRAMRLVTGFIVGFLLISGLVGVLWATGALAFGDTILQGSIAWKYAVLWAALSLTVGFFEEGLLRGYLQSTLTRGLGFWWAALLLSVLFGCLHLGNDGESLAGILNIMVAGLVCCLALRLTGSLWWIVGVHAGIDFAESYFYGTPDSGMLVQGHLFETHPIGDALWSGGTAGPEASVYALAAFALLGVGIWLTWGVRHMSTATTRDSKVAAS
jgi:uncharacterized protein